MMVAPGVLGTLLTPAFLVTEMLLTLVNPLLLPGFQQWLPR